MCKHRVPAAKGARRYASAENQISGNCADRAWGGCGMQERRKRKAAGQDVVGGEDDIFARFRRAIAGSQGGRVRGVDPTVNVAADNFDRLAPGFGLSHLPTLVGVTHPSSCSVLPWE